LHYQLSLKDFGANLNIAEKDISIDNSNIASMLSVFSARGMRLEDSQILADQGMYFKAVQNYVLLKSHINLAAYPTFLFAYLASSNRDGSALARCALNLGEIEALGIFDLRGYSYNVGQLKHHLINSALVPLEIIDCIARAES
jgi:hypothetical protein